MEKIIFKILLLLLLCSTGYNMFGQCDDIINSRSDKFEKTTQRFSHFNVKNGNLSLNMNFYCSSNKPEDLSFSIEMYYSKKFIPSPDPIVIFLFQDNETSKFKFRKGEPMFFVFKKPFDQVSEEGLITLKKLRSKKVSSIRIQITGNDDFDLTQEESDLLYNMINCLYQPY